jgi:uncharacterized DUF497 family protein
MIRTVIYGDFEWDADKAESNQQKHGVSFEEAVTALLDDFSLLFEDLLEPDRFILIGASARDKILVVIHTAHETRVRIISAREATSPERKRYEDGK